jgi:hypothetical protein
MTVTKGIAPAAGTTIWTHSFINEVISIDVDSITYDLDNQVVGAPINVSSAKQTCDNSASPIAVTCTLTLTFSYTDTTTLNWSTSDALTQGVKSTTKISLPSVDESLEFSLTSTQTITNGKSSAEAVGMTITSTASISVPAHSVYSAQIMGQEAEGTINYDWVGTATYAEGQRVAVEGTGIFDGVGTTNFTIVYTCISAPDGCGTSSAPATITEPVLNAPVVSSIAPPRPSRL